MTPGPTPTAAATFVDCNAIADGNATTAADSIPFNVTLNLVINNSYSFSTVAGELQAVLQFQVAPVVAGCPASRRRVLVEATIVNVLFSTPQQGSCKSSSWCLLALICLFATHIAILLF
jgi:subtilase family serine protease